MKLVVEIDDFYNDPKGKLLARLVFEHGAIKMVFGSSSIADQLKRHPVRGRDGKEYKLSDGEKFMRALPDFFTHPSFRATLYDDY